MTENNVPKNIPDNMDVVVVIDKEKLPEDVRRLLEENLPKDAPEQLKLLPEQLKLSLEQLKLSQEKVLKMLGRPPAAGKLDNSTLDNIENMPDNKLFAIQTGSVVGNIYTDGTYKKEEDSYVKKKDVNNSGRCC